MKIKRPAVQVEVCDTCQREGYLETCLVCGERYCLTCRGIMCGCMIAADLCRKCAKREDVGKVVERYAARISPIVKLRGGALRRLPAQVKED